MIRILKKGETKMSLLEPLTYDRLRWEYTTRQLLKLAAFMKLDVSDIPKNGKRKYKLAKKIWNNCHRNPKATFK